MDKLTWRQVKALSSSSHKPSSRWGHSCCVVGQDIVFFGGYADSTYMNDLWAFNSVTMKWRQIETFGDIPAQRSNCTMNYDPENNQIVIFGGGGANKQRFNSISILDWKTKEWIEITPKQNQTAPWQRTYHVAQLIFPYLLVFGGEGVADMDDLWAFSFQTLSWTQIKIPNDKVKPCARRFHSSVKIGNEFIVLAGCHGKYRCLSDVFSMDLTSLVKTGKTDLLEWKQKKLKNSSFLTRWGHSSAVYDNKIYIFGGRFSNDLNDLLVADFETNTIRQLKTSQDAPAARRRHCSGFIGSSMLVFGGFNGQYFQDLHYISVHEARPKYEIASVFDQKVLEKQLNKKEFSDFRIKSIQDLDFYFNIGWISKYFETEHDIDYFLNAIDNQYTIEELEDIFTVLYNGYGQIPKVFALKDKLSYPVFEQKSEKLTYEKERIEKFNDSSERKIFKKSIQPSSPVIRLNEEDFLDYYTKVKRSTFFNYHLFVGQLRFGVNKIKLITKSQYFANLLTKSDLTQKLSLIDILGEENKTVYQMFFNFLESDWLVVPDNVSAETFLQLIMLADYFCVKVLSQLCCNELMGMLTSDNVESILKSSIQLKLSNVSKACCDFWIKKATESVKVSDLKQEVRRLFNNKKKMCEQLESMIQRIGFDLAQTTMEIEKPVPNLLKKGISSNSNMEKENYETNVYNH